MYSVLELDQLESVLTHHSRLAHISGVSNFVNVGSGLTAWFAVALLRNKANFAASIGIARQFVQNASGVPFSADSIYAELMIENVSCDRVQF